MTTRQFISILFLLLLLSPVAAQDRLQFGLRSNIGLFGVRYPKGYELEEENSFRKDDYYQYANLAFTAGVLMEYTFYKKGDFSMAVQTEFGYTYTSFKKVWGFHRGFDETLNTYIRERDIIHDLKAIYLSLPIRGSMQYKRWKGSLGVVGSRVFSATADRNNRTRENVPFTEWVDAKTHWRATKTNNEADELFTPYLTHLYTWQGIMSLEYQLTKNIFIGLEGRRFYRPMSLVSNISLDEAQVFYYKGDMLSLSFLYVR